MPRKAAAAAGESGAPASEPRRSSRIKEQPKPEPVVKRAPAKPRVKKADKEKQEGEADKEEKPKSARGKKRKEAEVTEATEANGAAPGGEGEEPPAKKVRALFACLAYTFSHDPTYLGQTCFQDCRQTVIQGIQ